MKLRKYIKHLKKLVKKYPELLDKKVIYSIDDEGNSFHRVCNTPTPGKFKKGDFDYEVERDNFNSVCIN